MKHLRLFSFVLASLLAGVMSSCLNSDSDDNKDYEKIQAQFKAELAASKGNFGGYLHHFTSTGQVFKSDSVAATWSVVNDSTIELSNVPVSYLAAQVNDSILRAQLAAAGTVDMTVRIYYYAAVSPLTYYVQPEDVYVTYTDDAGVPKGQATFHFYNTENTNGLSYGSYSMTTNEHLLRLLPRDIYIGGSMQQRFDDNAILVWYGKKK